MNRQFSMQSRSSSCFSLHHLRIMLIFLLMMTEICHGFLWLSKSNSLKTLGTAHSDIHNDVAKILSEKEIESLRLNYDALQSYSRKPDCFKRAAGLVRAQCMDLDMDEDARVEAAITMTLCEVATAKHHSFPLECSPYLYDASSQSGRASVSSKVQGECVDSLARSAQFWSSYSGYLREVPQLCYAFRRWNDIDSAKDIYHNATVEKIALIRFLVNREKMISKHTDRWTEMSSEMGQLVGQFELLSQKYHSNVDDFALLLKDEVDNTLRSFRSMLHDIFSRQEKANIQSASLFQVSLNDLFAAHSKGLSTLVNSFDALLSSRLDKLLSLHESRHEQLDLALLSLQERWSTLGGYFDGITETIFKLSDHTAHLSQALEMAAHGASNIHALQTETFVAATALGETLNHLTETANEGLSRINGSVLLIERHLEGHIKRTGQTWTSWAMHILGLIFRAEPESFQYLERQFSFRLLLSFLVFIWTTLSAMASTVSTISIVLFFATRRFCVRKSAAILANVLQHSTSTDPFSRDRRVGSGLKDIMHRAMGENSPDQDPPRKMPGNLTVASHRKFADDRYQRRVSRIPGRLWNASSN